MANSPYVQSGPNSRYGSPASSQWGGEPMYHSQQPMMAYGPYGSPVPVHAQPHAYGSPPYLGRGVSTPPTSTHSQDDGQASRKTKPRATKRKNKPAADKPNVPLLEKPLSELTKDLTVPVKDMEAWVNRSVEAREAEAAKRNGQIARPMNSFMLYRSAYAERTKAWCTQNNHQVVSAVSGKSWPMEPTSVRDWYNDLAKQERENHQKAFPGYKFSPSKTNAAGQRKRKELEDEEEAVLTERESDSEYRPGGGTRRRPRPSNHSATPDLNYGYHPGYTSAPGPLPYRLQGREHMNPSHFSASNPGQMVPEPMQHAYDQQYYEMQQYPETQMPGGGPQDMAWLQQHAHAMQAAHHQSVVGLPGGAHSDMLDEHAWNETPLPEHGDIDPMLMPEYADNFLSHGQMPQAGAFNERSFQDFEGDLAQSHYGPPTGGSGRGLVSFSQVVKSTEDEQEEFERIMSGKSG